MTQRMTLDFLSEQGACSDQMELFTELFPNGTEVTRQLCIRYADEFDFDWALENLLPEEAKAECVRINDEAWAKYQRIRNEAWAKYNRTQDKTLAKWQHIRNSGRIDDEAWAECLRTQNKTWEECDRGLDKAWAEYRRIHAIEFARLWNKYMSD